MGRNNHRMFVNNVPKSEEPRATESTDSHTYWVRVAHKGVGRALAEQTNGEYNPGNNTVTTGYITKEKMQLLNKYYGPGIRKYKLQM
ncbi:MAG: hypothetical protein V1648_02230 [Candidatus Aenigmatarchaeota archaeon]